MPKFLRAALLLAGLAFAARPALAADVVLDQATLAGAGGAKIVFKNIALKGTNLTTAEATSLFTGALSREDAGAMLARLSASEIRIPEADIEVGNGDRFTVKDIVAEKVAQGATQKLSFAGVDGVLPDDSGDSTLHLGPLQVERLSTPGVAAALAAGDPGVAAFRFSRLTWEGGDLSVVDKKTPSGAPGGNRILLHAGQATIDQTFGANGAPLDGTAAFTGLSLKMPPKSQGGATLAAFGYPELNGAFQIAGAYDPAAKIYRLKNYALDIQKIGRVALSAQISDVAPTAFVGEKAARQKALLDSTLDYAQIEVTNAGLFEKVVAFLSLSQGKTPDAVKAEWRAIVAQAPLLFSGASAITAVAKEVERFIADPKTLTLRIKGRDAPLKLGDFQNVADPAALLDKLQVTGSPARAGTESGTKL